MHKRLGLALSVLIFLAPHFLLARANSEPAPSADAAQEQEQQLHEATTKTTNALLDTKKQLVDSAAMEQTIEDGLSNYEDELHVLREQAAGKTRALGTYQKRLATLVQATIHLSQTPPEAALMMEGDSDQSIRHAHVIKMISDGIHRDMEDANNILIELKALEQKINHRRDDLLEKQKALAKVRSTLQQKMSERKALQKKLDDEYKNAMKKLADLKHSQKLTTAAKEATAAKALGGIKGQLRAFDSAKGRMHLPTNGKIIQEFGAEDSNGNRSKGLTILTHYQSGVVAPYDGEVEFAGPFHGYGQLVILRHSGDYHTLLSGLDHIDVHVGEFLLEGEPIGAMGESGLSNRLYFEIRHASAAVDPKHWLQKATTH